MTGRPPRPLTSPPPEWLALKPEARRVYATRYCMRCCRFESLCRCQSGPERLSAGAVERAVAASQPASQPASLRLDPEVRRVGNDVALRCLDLTEGRRPCRGAVVIVPGDAHDAEEVAVVQGPLCNAHYQKRLRAYRDRGSCATPKQLPRTGYDIEVTGP